MPKFNARGDILAGGGGERGSLNGAYWPFATVGGGAWWTDDVALVHLASPPVLALVNIHTQVPVPIEPQRGANSFAAGGGRYLAQLAGVGVYGDVPAVLPAAGLPENGVGRDGTRVYTPNAQAGFGFHGLNPDGSTFNVPGSLPYDVQVLGPNTVIWQRGAYGTSVPKPACAGANGVLVVDYHGVRWLLYWSESTGTVLQQDGASEGWVLDTRPMEFARDLIVVNDAIRIVWSITAGERPEDIVVLELRNGAIVYLRWAANWSPQTPVFRSLVGDSGGGGEEGGGGEGGNGGGGGGDMSELQTIQQIRGKYPTPLGAKHAQFMNEVCLALPAKMYEKNGGDHTTLPNGKNISLDVIIVHHDTGWADILQDAEGAAVPTWDVHPNPTGVYVPPLPMSAFEGGGSGGGGGEEGGGGSGGGESGGSGLSEADVRRIVQDELKKPRKVSLRTENGHYICAEGGGGNEVNATRSGVGGWETFTEESR